MTWQRTRETGSGKTEFDVVIAGAPYVLTTDVALDGTTDANGREFVAGVVRESLTTEETLELGEPRCKARGPTVRVVDVRGRATRLFARQPSRVAYLTASVTTSATTIAISQPLFDVGDVIHIGIEAMLVTAGGLTTTPTVVRGHWGTVAQAHYVEDGAAMRTPEVTDWPASMEGRGVTLRVYGESEATPTTIWRGRVVRDAELVDAATWSIACDSPMAALAQPLGDDLRSPLRLRGIVYGAGWPFVMELSSGLDFARIEYGRVVGDSPESIADVLTFFRTQQAFCERLSADIVAATASWSVPFVGPAVAGRRLQAVVDDASGGWYLAMTTGATAVDVAIMLRSEVDFGDASRRRARFLRRSPAGEYEFVTSLSALTTYAISWEPSLRGGTVAIAPAPRGSIGRPPAIERGRPISTALTQVALFVDGTAPSADAVRIGDATIAVASTDVTRNALVLDVAATDAAMPRGMTYVGGTPSIALTRSYGVGDLATLLLGIVADAPAESARGAVPWIEAGEVDGSALVAAVDTAFARGAPTWARSRVLGLAEPVELDEALGAEAAILGGVIAPGADGRLRLVLPESRAVTSGALTSLADAALIDSGAPGYARSSYGVVNTVVIKTGYEDGKWTGPTFRVRDVTAFGRNRTPRVIEIEPRFRSVDEAAVPPNANDAVAIARPWLSLLARPYSLVTLDVDYRAFGVGVGDAVVVSTALLPDQSTGTRGIESMTGVVVARRWSHGEGRGQLRLLVSHERIAGYTPTSRVIASTLVSGTTYDLLLAVTPPSGYADISVWRVGDGVLARQYDVASPAEMYGVVVAVTIATNTVRVTFGGTPPPVPSNLGYDYAPFAQETQKAYAWIASATTRDEGMTPARPARTYQ